MALFATGALVLDAVRLRHAGITVLDGVSLTAPPGEVTGLLGPNGAGKSSLLDVVAGVRRPDGGSVRLADERIDGRPAHRVARLGIGYAREQGDLFGALTVEENLRVGGHALDRAELALRLDVAYDGFPLLRNRRHHVADTLSGGEQRMLAIARAAVRGDRVLLLDEPSRGLASEALDGLWRQIRQLAAAGGVVVMAEQDGDRLRGADRCVVLDGGRLVE